MEGCDIIMQLRQIVSYESCDATSYQDFAMEKMNQIYKLPFTLSDNHVIKIIIG